MSSDTNTLPEIVTVGVYGFDERSFFGALVDANVDVFCDIRQRRGMRGSTYAFVNSKRLQERLADLEIQYYHFKSLAPTDEVRQRQKNEDERRGVNKRDRTKLGAAFIKAYEEICLDTFTAQGFFKEFDHETKTIALFCVEREPEACHRSLVTDRLTDEVGIKVRHLRP